MIFRKMQFEDIDKIVAIEQDSFSTPWTKQAFIDEFNNSKAFYFVVSNEETIVAYGGFWQILNEGHITNIAVSQNYKGKGIGYKLVLLMIEQGKKQGIDNFTLEVRQSNKPAIELYKKIGFNKAGVRKNYYQNPKEDALIMWYKINISY